MSLSEARQRVLTPWAYKAHEVREAMEGLLPGFTCRMKAHQVALDRRSGITRTGIVLTLIETRRWQPVASYADRKR